MIEVMMTAMAMMVMEETTNIVMNEMTRERGQ
jgi:hypothetical protein